MWYIIITFILALLFYLYKTSKNDFFFQSPEDLAISRNKVIQTLQNPIEVSEDFMSELKILLQQALLMDTRGFVQPFYGLEDNQLEIDTE